MSSPKFPLGRVVITRAALAELSDADVHGALTRHHAGDWGDLDAHDLAENELSLQQGYRLLSAYTSSSGTKFWIIVRRDRRSSIAG
jgi:hypothetical protein